MPAPPNSPPVAAIRPDLNAAEVRAWALQAGFTEAGVVALPHPAEARDAARFEQWIGAGNAGTMRYLERRGEDGQLLRARIAAPFPWARSAIVCYALYHCPQPLSIAPSEAGSGWIARYAWTSRRDAEGSRRPSDYHKVLKKRLAALEAQMHSQFGEFEARGFVDTGPLVERSLATAAGLGWTGKNTCLIHPKLGSYGFLAVLLTSLPVQRDDSRAALVPDRCGTCRRCLEACPTNALTPYQMDATKCISYLTIEHKGPIAEELMQGMGRQVFGCDICQDVCPWNRKAPVVVDPDLEPREELVNPALEWLAGLSEAEFEENFNGSPVRRAGFNGLRRNIAIAIGNSGQHRFAQLLVDWTTAADEGLHSAANWALQKLQSDPRPQN
ncbi:MAG TPA: tRNA epoxyqueuosine(34) reductase QueG [Terracidiphilus sp.]|nr:tRNA epoxyqueuosine(34) reductase QueG [Terracidiphilus sp.]